MKRRIIRNILISLTSFIIGYVMGMLLLSCSTSSVIFPYIEREDLGHVRFSRVQDYVTFVKTDSADLIIEGRHTLPLGEKAVYYRKYPNRNDLTPKVLLVDKKRYNIH